MTEYNLRIKEEHVDIARLHPNSWNPNEQTDFMQQKLGASLDFYGQVAEILVREIDGQLEIIDGEHRYRELLTKGVKKVLVNNLGEVSDDDARLLTVAMNELHGDRDPLKLSRVLNSLQKSANWGELSLVLPFGEAELENILQLSVDIPPVKKAPPEDGEKGTPTVWVDINLSILKEDLLQVKTWMLEAKKQLGIASEPDPALENGKLLKLLLGHGG